MDLLYVLDVASKCSIIVAVAAYLLQRRSMHLVHERARLEKATAAVLEFSRSLNPRSAASRKLARHLNDQQIEHLEQGREFSISQEDRDLLLAALPEHITAEEMPESGEIRLNRNQSFLLRWEIISRLNSSEVVAQCWLKDVADRGTIEDELRFLLDPEPGRNIFTTFRSIASAPNYPALAALIAELERQRSVTATPIKIDRK